MTLYPKLILDALATVRYPGNGKNIVEAEMVADNLRIDGMKDRIYNIFEIGFEGGGNCHSYLCLKRGGSHHCYRKQAGGSS